MQWLLQPIQQNSNPGKGLKSLHFHSLILIRFQKIPVKIFLDAKIVQAIHITKKNMFFHEKKLKRERREREQEREQPRRRDQSISVRGDIYMIDIIHRPIINYDRESMR